MSFVGPRPLVQATFDAYSQFTQKNINNVMPGLTGVGSIVFRDEESLISSVKNQDPHFFYKKNIAPYKGALELWYQNNQSFIVDFKILIVTAWVVFIPKSKLIYKWFKGLPSQNN